MVEPVILLTRCELLQRLQISHPKVSLAVVLEPVVALTRAVELPLAVASPVEA